MSGTDLGPDFICIGMIKAGTGWLFDQLKHHPDFWMPPVKEIRYLSSSGYPEMSIVKKRWERVQAAARANSERTDKQDQRNYEFLQEAVALRGRAMDYDGYKRLFRHKGMLLSGDISPMYSRLDDETVSEIAEHLPRTKIILLIRDPVARAWSGISMLHRHGKFDTSLLDDPGRFRAYYEEKREEHTFPSRIAERWYRCAPKVSFRHFFFDDIEKEPEDVRRSVLVYLGADPEKKSGQLSASHNRKANAKKLALTDPIRAVLLERFRDELHACAEVFGGPAREWLTRYGV